MGARKTDCIMQAKSGFKTRKKRNKNKYVVQERPRNQGKRRTTK